jgi:hypothetical protein
MNQQRLILVLALFIAFIASGHTLQIQKRGEASLSSNQHGASSSSSQVEPPAPPPESLITLQSESEFGRVKIIIKVLNPLKGFLEGIPLMSKRPTLGEVVDILLSDEPRGSVSIRFRNDRETPHTIWNGGQKVELWHFHENLGLKEFNDLADQTDRANLALGQDFQQRLIVRKVVPRQLTLASYMEKLTSYKEIRKTKESYFAFVEQYLVRQSQGWADVPTDHGPEHIYIKLRSLVNTNDAMNTKHWFLSTWHKSVQIQVHHPNIHAFSNSHWHSQVSKQKKAAEQAFEPFYHRAKARFAIAHPFFSFFETYVNRYINRLKQLGDMEEAARFQKGWDKALEARKVFYFPFTRDSANIVQDYDSVLGDFGYPNLNFHETWLSAKSAFLKLLPRHLYEEEEDRSDFYLSYFIDNQVREFKRFARDISLADKIGDILETPLSDFAPHLVKRYIRMLSNRGFHSIQNQVVDVFETVQEISKLQVDIWNPPQEEKMYALLTKIHQGGYSKLLDVYLSRLSVHNHARLALHRSFLSTQSENWVENFIEMVTRITSDDKLSRKIRKEWNKLKAGKEKISGIAGDGSAQDVTQQTQPEQSEQARNHDQRYVPSGSEASEGDVTTGFAISPPLYRDLDFDFYLQFEENPPHNARGIPAIMAQGRPIKHHAEPQIPFLVAHLRP